MLILSIAPGPVPTRMEGHHVLGARQTFQRFCSACFQLLFQSSCQTWFNQVATEKSMWPGAMARKGNSSTWARARRKDVGMCPGIVPGTRMCSSTRLLDMQNSRAWKYFSWAKNTRWVGKQRRETLENSKLPSFHFQGDCKVRLNQCQRSLEDKKVSRANGTLDPLGLHEGREFSLSQIIGYNEQALSPTR